MVLYWWWGLFEVRGIPSGHVTVEDSGNFASHWWCRERGKVVDFIALVWRPGFPHLPTTCDHSLHCQGRRLVPDGQPRSTSPGDALQPDKHTSAFLSPCLSWVRSVSTIRRSSASFLGSLFSPSQTLPLIQFLDFWAFVFCVSVLEDSD